MTTTDHSSAATAPTVERFYTPQEVAERYNLALQTLANWRHVGNRGPRYVKFAGLVRYQHSDLVEWERTSFRRCGGEAMAEAA